MAGVEPVTQKIDDLSTASGPVLGDAARLAAIQVAELQRQAAPGGPHSTGIGPVDVLGRTGSCTISRNVLDPYLAISSLEALKVIEPWISDCAGRSQSGWEEVAARLQTSNDCFSRRGLERTLAACRDAEDPRVLAEAEAALKFVKIRAANFISRLPRLCDEALLQALRPLIDMHCARRADELPTAPSDYQARLGAGSWACRAYELLSLDLQGALRDAIEDSAVKLAKDLVSVHGSIQRALGYLAASDPSAIPETLADRIAGFGRPEQARDSSLAGNRGDQEERIDEGTPFRVILSFIGATRPGAEDVVYDLGSGYGRVLIFGKLLAPAARFKGIEIDNDMAERTAALIAKNGLSGCSVEASNVRDADISDGTIFYMFNPFSKETTKLVLERLRQIAAARPIVIASYATLLLEGIPWLETAVDQNNPLLLVGRSTIHEPH